MCLQTASPKKRMRARSLETKLRVYFCKLGVLLTVSFCAIVCVYLLIVADAPSVYALAFLGAAVAVLAAVCCQLARAEGAHQSAAAGCAPLLVSRASRRVREPEKAPARGPAEPERSAQPERMLRRASATKSVHHL